MTGEITPLEQAKLDLERARLRSDMVKWVALAVGAVASFWIIDYGKLRLEEFRAKAQNERELLSSYLDATDSPDPDIWLRKLTLLNQLSEDEDLRAWASRELVEVETYDALRTYYREALTTAAQLIDPATLDLPVRTDARRRFEQLYWADLPFAGESKEVENAMVKFRRAMMVAEAQGKDGAAWKGLNADLIELSKVLSAASRKLRRERRAQSGSQSP